MNKTQLLSDTENLIYCLGKTHFILKQEQLLDTAIKLVQLPPEMINRKFFCSFIFGDTSHMSTIQDMKSKIQNTYLIS